MSRTRSDYVSNIRALWSKVANAAATSEEKDAAAEKALEWMRKHSVSVRELGPEFHFVWGYMPKTPWNLVRRCFYRVVDTVRRVATTVMTSPKTGAVIAAFVVVVIAVVSLALAILPWLAIGVAVYFMVATSWAVAALWLIIFLMLVCAQVLWNLFLQQLMEIVMQKADEHGQPAARNVWRRHTQGAAA